MLVNKRDLFFLTSNKFFQKFCLFIDVISIFSYQISFKLFCLLLKGISVIKKFNIVEIWRKMCK